MDTTLRLKLSIMMFLQYAIWGVWYVTMGTYLGQTLGFSGTVIGLAYSTTAVAAMISPFFVGMIADRFFANQKMLGVLHIAGGLFLFLASQTLGETGFLWVLLLYSLCYMPTLALTNTLCFHHMRDPERQFPGVRVLGTIGWIIAGLTVGFLQLEPTAVPLKIGAVLSVLMGAYCFALPNTPPRAAGKRVTARDVLGLDALSLLKERSFLVFIISCLLICIPLAFYYAFANRFLNDIGVANAAAKMTMGQVSEIFFMLVLPFFLIRWGIKKVLIVGMLAWVIRYVLFGFGDAESMVFMLYAGIILHGICYDFFFVAGQIYVNKKASPEIRGAAQGFLAFITFGVGAFIGSVFSGRIVDAFTTVDPVTEVAVLDWQSIWLVPAGMAAVVMVFFILLFNEKSAPAVPTPPAEPSPDAAPAP